MANLVICSGRSSDCRPNEYCEIGISFCQKCSMLCNEGSSMFNERECAAFCKKTTTRPTTTPKGVWTLSRVTRPIGRFPDATKSTITSAAHETITGRVHSEVAAGLSLPMILVIMLTSVLVIVLIIIIIVGIIMFIRRNKREKRSCDTDATSSVADNASVKTKTQLIDHKVDLSPYLHITQNQKNETKPNVPNKLGIPEEQSLLNHNSSRSPPPISERRDSNPESQQHMAAERQTGQNPLPANSNGSVRHSSGTAVK